MHFLYGVFSHGEPSTISVQQVENIWCIYAFGQCWKNNNDFEKHRSTRKSLLLFSGSPSYQKLQGGTNLKNLPRFAMNDIIWNLPDVFSSVKGVKHALISILLSWFIYRKTDPRISLLPYSFWWPGILAHPIALYA